jgi:hypothetical protein
VALSGAVGACVWRVERDSYVTPCPPDRSTVALPVAASVHTFRVVSFLDMFVTQECLCSFARGAYSLASYVTAVPQIGGGS